jgi:succinate dehydrogenase / fumarate reductase cytochrome b subunit
MKWSEFFTSSVGKKLVMALTGLFLICFLVVHVGINACIWATTAANVQYSGTFYGLMVVIRVMELIILTSSSYHTGLCPGFQPVKKKDRYKVPRK